MEGGILLLFTNNSTGRERYHDNTPWRYMVTLKPNGGLTLGLGHDFQNAKIFPSRKTISQKEEVVGV